MKVKRDHAFKCICICPHFIYSIITQRYNCAKKYWNIYFPCVSFLWASEMSCTVKQPIRAELNIELHCETANQSRAQQWFTLWNSQSEQSSTLSRTVKQPIRAELNIELHCETANQSRAQQWFTLWNSQSEQSSTLLFMTLPNKPITDRFILGRNPRVVNGHVKLFLENFCPYLSHIPVRVLSCASCVPASCFHIWFVSGLY